MVSTTVVAGCFFAKDFFTNLPVFALRATFSVFVIILYLKIRTRHRTKIIEIRTKYRTCSKLFYFCYIIFPDEETFPDSASHTGSSEKYYG